MRVKIAVQDIAKAAANRPPGYIEALMAASVPCDDSAWREIPEAELDRLKTRYGLPTEPPSAGCGGCGR